MDKNLERLAVGLGWFSVALGLAELLAPRSVGRASGLEHRPGLLRLYGLRELAAGLGLLSGGSAAFWLWARAAGDAMDLATVAPGLTAGGARRRRAARAAAAVAGAALLDVYGGARARRAEEARLP